MLTMGETPFVTGDDLIVHSVTPSRNVTDVSLLTGCNKKKPPNVPGYVREWVVVRLCEGVPHYVETRGL